MIRFCLWGMHRPGALKVFNQGMQFTRCVDCDATLVAGSHGWRRLPAGRRVAWRKRTEDDAFFNVSCNPYRARLRFDPIAPFRRR